MRILPLLSLLFVQLIGCQENGPDDEVLTIGETTVTSAEVTRRQDVEEAFLQDSLERDRIIAGMIGEGLEKEVARKLGLLPTDAEISALSKQADEMSGAPEDLKRIKGVFGNDTAEYRTIFLLPKAITAKLQEYVRTSANAQQQNKARIDQAMTLVGSGAAMDSVARSLNLLWTFDTLGPNRDRSAELLARYGQPMEKDPLMQLADTLTLGQIFPQVLEDRASYRIFRVAKRENGEAIVESIQAPKTPYELWMRTEAHGIPIVIHDKETEKKIRELYPTAWWLENLKGK